MKIARRYQEYIQAIRRMGFKSTKEGMKKDSIKK